MHNDDAALELLERALAGELDNLEEATAGLDERRAASVRRAAALAREVRRRRSLTTSVSQFAATITSVRGTDSALQQLVAGTRRLAGVDIAYVSLRGDDDGRTHIAATDGAWTEAFRELRMPAGVGVLGRVVTAGVPVRSVDYAHDDALIHDAEVDRIVAAEGVRSILGAPVRIDGRIVGALLVADRHAHRFDDDDLFVVTTLADLAAVAIDNVRRLRELSDDVAAERASAELEARTRATVERARRIDGALVSALRSGGGVHDLAGALATVLAHPLRVVDLTVRYDLDEGTAPLEAAERELLAAAMASGEPAAASPDAPGPRTVAAARRGTEAAAAIVVEGRLDPPGRALLAHAAEVVAAFLVARERARGDIAQRRRELIEQLIAPPVGGIAAATLTRLAEFGVRPAGPFRLLVAAGTPAALAALDHRLELDFGRTLLRAEFDGRMLAVVPEAAFERLAAAVDAARGGGSWRGLRIGHSPPLHAFEIIPAELDLVRQVLQARLAGAAPGGDDGVLVSLRSYGAIGSFLSKVHLAPTRQLIDELVGPLLAYDREHGTPLVETAFVYLDGGHAVSAAARRLHVHANTVRQRLDRIAALLGSDWADGQRGLDHHIALSAHRILGESSP